MRVLGIEAYNGTSTVEASAADAGDHGHGDHSHTHQQVKTVSLKAEGMIDMDRCAASSGSSPALRRTGTGAVNTAAVRQRVFGSYVFRLKRFPSPPRL